MPMQIVEVSALRCLLLCSGDLWRRKGREALTAAHTRRRMTAIPGLQRRQGDHSDLVRPECSFNLV